MNLTHPLRVTLGQIIVDCDDTYALSFKSVQICRKCTDESLTFTGSHLSDTSLMQDDATDQLNMEVFHSQNTSRSFAHDRIGFGKNVIEGLSARETVLEFRCLCLQFFIRERQHIGAKCLDLIYDRHDTFEFPVTMSAEYHFK